MPSSKESGSRKIAKIRIVIASANLMTSRLLAQVLERQPDFQVIALVGDNASLLVSLQSVKPDVALISIHLQDGPFSGLARLQDISHQLPDLPWILLFDRMESQLVIDAFRAGARGVFCCLESETKLLCKCIRRVVEGQIWADATQMRRIVEALSSGSSGPASARAQTLSLLTAREETVVRLVAQGLSNREIAQHLGLSEHTVKNNVFHIFEKLGFSNRVELVLYAIAKLNQAEFPSMDVPNASATVTSRAPRPGLSKTNRVLS